MSRGIKILADTHVDSLDVDSEWDLVAIPGGMPGASNLAASPAVQRIVKTQADATKPVAAVCASPAVVLEPLGVLAGKSATCYPALAFLDAVGDKAAPGDVVVDGNLVTSRGPGTSLKFALALVDKLYGPEKARDLAEQMLVATDHP
ncbi:hypothetical protein CTAYLR_009370 [Chrysophaeum taylorii]|uniref:DJ-1/PfpI domain-containing protein n=1 Tax=Chrysophaeum taylorii TaxID=2483200 RepID=A0AAD7UBE6_9STRA|nr:hypothetical protein CTAYLR_009370 [Chrysophaeum taylorii]